MRWFSWYSDTDRLNWILDHVRMADLHFILPHWNGNSDDTRRAIDAEMDAETDP